MRISVRLVAAAAVMVAMVPDARAKETYEFSRYQVILDRGPFGPVTATEAAGATPGFASQLQLVGFVYSNSVLPQVIIQDKQANNRWYFRAEGELVNEATVVSIDIAARKVVLQKGLEKATLAVEERPNTPAPTPAAQVQPPGAPPGAQFPTAPGARRIPFRRSN